LLADFSADDLGRWRARLGAHLPRVRRVVIGVSLLVLAWVVVALTSTAISNVQTLRQLYAVGELRAQAGIWLNNAPRNGTILAPWHYATPLWYLQQVEGLRPDVTVQYVYPRGDQSPEQLWADTIRETLSDGRTTEVLVLQQFPETYQYLPYSIGGNSISGAIITSDLPVAAITTDAWTATPLNLPQVVWTGSINYLTVTWVVPQAVPYGSISTYLHLYDPQENLISQIDLPLQTHEGGLVTVTYPLFVPRTISSGIPAVLRFGVYGPNMDTIRAGRADVFVQQSFGLQTAGLPTRNPLSINLLPSQSTAINLSGWDYDTTDPAQPLLYLRFPFSFDNTFYSETLSLTYVSNGQTVNIERDANDQPLRFQRAMVIPLPPDVRAVTLTPVQRNIGSDFFWPRPYTLRLPERGTYVPMGNTAVLVGSEVRQQGNRVFVALEWLAMGATMDEINIAINVDGAPFNPSPVYGALPSTKWRYGQVIRSEQWLALASDAPIQSVRVNLYNSFSGEIQLITPLSLTNNAPGVRIYP
jgi:hypothetical protein